MDDLGCMPTRTHATQTRAHTHTVALALNTRMHGMGTETGCALLEALLTCFVDLAQTVDSALPDLTHDAPAGLLHSHGVPMHAGMCDNEPRAVGTGSH